MNKKLIENWNNTVPKNAKVIHCGDFFVGCDLSLIDEILPQLNGKIILVRGNHDSEARLKKYAEHGVEIHDIYYQNYGGLFFVFCHFPLDESPELLQMVNIDNSEVSTVMGHLHDKRPFWNRWNHSFNVCVDVIDYTPVSISKLFRLVKEDFAEKEVWRENGEEI